MYMKSHFLINVSVSMYRWIFSYTYVYVYYHICILSYVLILCLSIHIYTYTCIKIHTQILLCTYICKFINACRNVQIYMKVLMFSSFIHDIYHPWSFTLEIMHFNYSDFPFIPVFGLSEVIGREKNTGRKCRNFEVLTIVFLCIYFVYFCMRLYIHTWINN